MEDGRRVTGLCNVNFVYRVGVIRFQHLVCVCLWQVVTNRETQETLLCTAYVFEVSTSEHGAQHHIYRLIKD